MIQYGSVIYFLFICLCYFVIAEGEGGKNLYDDATNVKEIPNLAAYNTFLNSGQSLLVVYYSPWCPHCQHFAPLFTKLSDQNVAKQLIFGAVNCDALPDICRSSKYVQGYPSLVAVHIPSNSPGNGIIFFICSTFLAILYF